MTDAEPGDDDCVVGRRIVLPTPLWRVLQSVADEQGIAPMELAAKAVRAGLGAVASQTPAIAPLAERLDELPGEDDDAWLEGL